jgi:hypothetical protein
LLILLRDPTPEEAACIPPDSLPPAAAKRSRASMMPGSAIRLEALPVGAGDFLVFGVQGGLLDKYVHTHTHTHRERETERERERERERQRDIGRERERERQRERES